MYFVLLTIHIVFTDKVKQTKKKKKVNRESKQHKKKNKIADSASFEMINIDSTFVPLAEE